MAENKKSVVLYCDIIHTIKSLTNEEAGKLFKHYLEYINDLNPKSDRLTELLFEPIKQNLKRDLKRWEKKSERNSVIAKDAWIKRKDANACESIKDDAKDADNVNANVNANVNVKKIILPEVKKLRADCKEFFLNFYKESKSTEYYWVAKDSASLITLLKQIEIKIKEKSNLEIVPESEKLLGFQLIIKNIKDNWIKDNFTIPIISSKFNEIYTQIKNGKDEKPNIDSNGKPISRFSPLYQNGKS